MAGQARRDYPEQRGIAAAAKVLTVGYSVLFVVEAPAIQALLLLIAVCVTAHLLSFRTLRR